jgi:hypothetical protein
VLAIPSNQTLPTAPNSRFEPLSVVLHALAPIAAVVVMLGVAAPAGAATCGRQVIDDWYDDGRVDRTYALHCYDDAIDALPPDVRQYSSAQEDIERALQARMRGQASPPAKTDPTPRKKPKPTTTQSTTTGSKPKEETTPEAVGAVDDDSASSVPIPLLVLAGLALLLIAGGSAGYFVRRYQGRNNPPPAR